MNDGALNLPNSRANTDSGGSFRRRTLWAVCVLGIIFVTVAIYARHKQSPIQFQAASPADTNSYLRLQPINRATRRLTMAQEALFAAKRTSAGNQFRWGGGGRSWSNELVAYAQWLGADVMISPTLLAGTAPRFAFSNRFRPTLMKQFDRMAATNGVEMIEAPDSTRWFAPVAEVPGLRSALAGKKAAAPVNPPPAVPLRGKD